MFVKKKKKMQRFMRHKIGFDKKKKIKNVV